MATILSRTAAAALSTLGNLGPAAMCRSVDGDRECGDSAEERFRRLTGANRVSRRAEGDARIGEFLFEVKFVGGREVVNQFRGEKWLTLIVLQKDVWYVAPPQDVARLAAVKPRGQHGANPFESARLSVLSFSIDHRVSAEG